MIKVFEKNGLLSDLIDEKGDYIYQITPKVKNLFESKEYISRELFEYFIYKYSISSKNKETQQKNKFIIFESVLNLILYYKIHFDKFPLKKTFFIPFLNSKKKIYELFIYQENDIENMHDNIQSSELTETQLNFIITYPFGNEREKDDLYIKNENIYLNVQQIFNKDSNDINNNSKLTPEIIFLRENTSLFESALITLQICLCGKKLNNIQSYLKYIKNSLKISYYIKDILYFYENELFPLLYKEIKKDNRKEKEEKNKQSTTLIKLPIENKGKLTIERTPSCDSYNKNNNKILKSIMETQTYNKKRIEYSPNKKSSDLKFTQFSREDYRYSTMTQNKINIPSITKIYISDRDKPYEKKIIPTTNTSLNCTINNTNYNETREIKTIRIPFRKLKVNNENPRTARSQEKKIDFSGLEIRLADNDKRNTSIKKKRKNKISPIKDNLITPRNLDESEYYYNKKETIKGNKWQCEEGCGENSNCAIF